MPNTTRGHGDQSATVAIGVVLDTFVVRALLVPAITHRLGERAWWPSRPAGGEPGASEPQ